MKKDKHEEFDTKVNELCDQLDRVIPEETTATIVLAAVTRIQTGIFMHVLAEDIDEGMRIIKGFHMSLSKLLNSIEQKKT